MTRDEIERLNEAGMSAWDKHDTDGFLSLFADDFTWTDDTRPEPIRSSDAGKEYMRAWFTAFPDMHVRTTNAVIGDDSIACEIEFTGTNTGPLAMGGMEMPPTGKPVTGHGCYFAKTSNGKITEFHSHPDAAGMMAQLGLLGV